MKIKQHEWSQIDESAGERRYFRAGKFGGRWTFSTTLKSDEDWTKLEPAPLDFLLEVRSLLERKYQRRRVPWEDVVAIDKLVGAAGGERITKDAAPQPR
jgi:hypothetical protein